MAYLRLYDYYSNLQQPTLNQLIQANDAIRIVKESVSQAQITSYLIQKYDPTLEFTNTTVFSPTAVYKANSLVEINYTSWATSTLYLVNNLVNYTDGKVYICTVNTTIAYELPTNTGFWRLVGTIYDLNYISYPYPQFLNKSFYAKGDRVFWKGKIYQNLVPTNIPSHSASLQAGTYANLAVQNIFPDDPVNGIINWGTGVDYSVTGLTINAVVPSNWVAGAYTIGQRVLYTDGKIWKALTNNSKEPSKDITNWQSETWTAGDNRNAQIVECMVWITIRKLSPLISPRNIPVLWEQKYNEYITWLQMAAEGDVTLNAQELQPYQGARLRYGGNIKQNNGY